MDITKYKTKKYLRSPDFGHRRGIIRCRPRPQPFEKENMMENKKILIVDDEPPILRLLSQLFTKAGYEVFHRRECPGCIKNY